MQFIFEHVGSLNHILKLIKPNQRQNLTSIFFNEVARICSYGLYINYVTRLRGVGGGGGKTLRSVMCVVVGGGLGKGYATVNYYLKHFKPKFLH